jgi:tetratricopeptide (TPR) repeat protein
MANIELRKRFFGAGVVGSIDLPSAPTLSWSEHHALVESSADLRQVRSTLECLDMDVRSVARAIDGLEGELGLRLDQQSLLLDRQVDLLADIAQSLRTPARVRAAERLSSVGELLRRKRYERAVAAAEEAIEDDPNNPAGFIAAGWAQIGLEHLEAARALFIEAAQASDGDARSAVLRQAARLTLALEGAKAALTILDGKVSSAHSVTECAAVAYDRAVYLAELGDTTAAQAGLLDAGRDEPSFLFAALADPLLVSHTVIIEAAVEELTVRQRAVAPHIARYDELIQRLDELVSRLEDEVKTLQGAGRGQRQQVLGELTEVVKRCSSERSELVAHAERALQVQQLSSGINELQETLEHANAREDELFESALRVAKLERTALDFALREDAWPTKLKDGTWKITKKRLFAQQVTWRATLDDGGEPAIELAN